MNEVIELEPPKSPVYLSLGSNIFPKINLPKAVLALDKRFGVMALSSVWQTPSIGSQGPDFLNCALMIQTNLSPTQLKYQVFRPLEAQFGRVRTLEKNAPRPLDVDVMIYFDLLLEPELWSTPHLAVPLAEIYPAYTNPHNGLTIDQIAAKMRAIKITKIKGDLLQV